MSRPRGYQTLQPCTLGLAYWKGIDQVPAQFLCQEALDATAKHDLGKLCRVAKRIWQPKLQG